MTAQATRCYDCGSYVSRDIYFGRFGKRNNVPLWVCPNCGVVHEDYRWFKYVSQQEANAIIEHRGPRGLFVLETGVEYIGIDNSTGDAWTEEFPDLTECMMWLAGEKEAAQAAKAQRKYETGDGPDETWNCGSIDASGATTSGTRTATPLIIQTTAPAVARVFAEEVLRNDKGRIAREAARWSRHG